MKSLIRKILKEEYQPTETDLLYIKLPKKFIDELGFDLYNENDVVYIMEIHFDTQNVLFSFYTKDLGYEIHYQETDWIPARFDGYKTIPIKKLPENILNFILRRIKPFYLKFID